MKVLYDSQIFAIQKFGGISRYFCELAFNNDGKFESVVSAKITDNAYINIHDPRRTLLTPQYYFGKNTLIKYIDRYYDRRMITNSDYDLFHPTYYYPIVFPNNKKTIITVYDMIHEHYPELYSPNDKTIHFKKYCVHKADAVIAISENTKKDLLSMYPSLSEDKIRVIHLGIDWNPSEKHDLNVLSSKDGYVLFTGVRSRYKNFDSFAKAIAPLLGKYGLNLVLTGNSLDRHETDYLMKLGILDKTRVVFAKEDYELKSLYENAICFVFPSLYEGFGIPILEAFASGCPIVLSNSSCFPEVAGDAGCYFNPEDIMDMRNRIEEVISSREKRLRMIGKGYERYKHFSKEKMIEKTHNLYQSMV